MKFINLKWVVIEKIIKWVNLWVLKILEVNMKFKRVNLKIELLILEGNIRNFKISKDIYEISLINKKLRI